MAVAAILNFEKTVVISLLIERSSLNLVKYCDVDLELVDDI